MTVIEKIKQENNPKNTIIKYMKEYSEKTGRNCILYSSEFLTKPSEVTNIDLSDKLGFITVIESLDKSKGLDLILHTPGGSLMRLNQLLTIYMQHLEMISEQSFLN